RNYIHDLPVRIAIGEVEVEGHRKIMGGPVTAVVARSARYVAIAPGKGDREAITKKLASIFGVPIEEVARAMPPGSVEIVERHGTPGIAHRRVPEAGKLHTAMDRHSLGDSRFVSPGGPAEAVDPRPPLGGTARHSRTPVLQDRILQPDGEPQSEHGARTSMVRETGGVRTPDDGDGRRSMGHRAGVRGEPRRAADDHLLGSRGPRLEDAAS